MNFSNRSPFPALAYTMIDVAEQEHHVVVLRQTFDLVRSSEGCTPQLDVFEAVAILKDPPPLVMEDRYSGETGESSVLEESDLAPFKPRCDVIVNANAYAPGGRPSRRWPVRVRASSQMLEDYRARKAGRSPGKPAELLDKSLEVCGPRRIRPGLLGWSLEEPQPAIEVPVDYEHAFGGTSRVPNPEHARDPGKPEFLLNEACYANPIGSGWIDERLPSALRGAKQSLESLPGPQVEYADARLKSPAVLRQPDAPHSPEQMARLVRGYPGKVAGLGCVGRAWTPRIQHAGSYDATWLDERWPHLPKDFEFDYWNAAPKDQQIEFPPPDLNLELTNLVSPALAPSGVARIALPGHRVFVMFKPPKGLALPLPFRIDTVIVDARAMRVSVVWRFSAPKSQPIVSLEVRFEADPNAPLPFPQRPMTPQPDAVEKIA